MGHHLRSVIRTVAAMAAMFGGVCAVSAATWPAVEEMAGVHDAQSAILRGNSPFADWRTLRSPLLRSPVLAWGEPVAVGGGSAETMLRLLVESSGNASEFTLESDRTVGRLRRVHWTEQRDGLPVLCGRADATLNDRGELMRWGMRSHADYPVRDEYLMDASACAEQLLGSLCAGSWSIERSFAAWFPDTERHDLVPAYWLRVAGVQPHERWEGVVSAINGEILLDWPGITTETVSGTVSGPYWQPYIQSPEQIGPFAHAAVYVDSQRTNTGMNGEYTLTVAGPTWISARLHGLYCAAENEDGPAGDLYRDLAPPYAPTDLQWNTTEAAAPELNLYYHTTLVHDWYKVLDPAFDALDYPMPAVANVGSGYDNAYWNGYGTYYGSGSTYQNFAMFSDVIYHEYTHGVTDGIYPNGMLPYVDQPGAMNEAWSDYVACTMNGDPLMGEYLLPNNPYSAFRDLENNLVYPQNWQGEVHADSRFVSGALWRIRAVMGDQFTNELTHFARYALAETFFDYLVAVLETDDNDGNLANGTPNSALIYSSFGIHGIGPGDQPQFEIRNLSYFADGSGGSSGDGDRFMEQGETVVMQFTLANGAPLFPPPAEGVLVQVTTNDESVQISGGAQSFPTLAAGDELTLAPVQFVLPANGPDRWLEVMIHVTANSGSAVFDYPVEFTIGRPHILIVNDDPDSDVEHFVDDAIRAHGRTFERVQPSDQQAVPADFYPNTGLVIWLSGNASGAVLTAEDQERIQQFMDAGNKVVLSGQNIVDHLAGTEFATQVLGVEITSDSLMSNAITVWNEPLPPGEWYLITGSRGAANQREPSAFTELGEARMVARYGRVQDGAGAIVESPNGRLLLFGFGIEAISGMASGSAPLDSLLSRLYSWSGLMLDAPDSPAPPAAATELALRTAYPNPFNNATIIRYSIPPHQRAELLIFDIAGRLVELQSLSGSGEYRWTPTVASGVYFSQLRSDAGASAPLKLMLLK